MAGTQPHETPGFHKGAGTIGDSVARQSQDGEIHWMTTRHETCLHLTFNEAWILSGKITSCGGREAEANALLTRTYRAGYELPYQG